MEVGKLSVEERDGRGKGAARRLRAQGKIPGIYYGKGEEPLAIALDPRAFMHALDPQKKQNTVFTVTVAGDSGHKELTAMLRDYQSDALSSALTHVDLVSVDITKDVTVEVPVEFVGKAAGTVDGGQVHAVYRRIPVRCKPTDIPNLIQVDVTSLYIGDALHVDEIQFPQGVVAALDGRTAVVSCIAPVVEVAPVVEAVAEGAVVGEAAAGAVGAPGAAPAAGGEKKEEAKKDDVKKKDEGKKKD